MRGIQTLKSTILYCAGIIILSTNLTWSATYYVSPDGDDGNDGSQGSPFKTLHHTRDALRQISGEAKEVIVKGGNYFLDSALRLTELDGGTEQNPVTWRGADNEWPVIYGGWRITGWTAHSGNIYKARLADNGLEYTDSTIWTLSENMKRCQIARHPNYFTGECNGAIKHVPDDPYQKAIAKFPAGSFDSEWSVDHCRVVQSCFGWFSSTRPVSSLDYAGGSITVDPSFADARSFEYWVEGSIDFIDTPGEFSVQPDGYIYYWPKKTPIEDQVIVAPKALRILDVRGSDTTNVTEYINFEKLILSTTDCKKHALSNKHNPYNLPDDDGSENNCEEDYSRHAIVMIENARNINLHNCKLYNAGINGVMFNYYAQNCEVYGCWLEGIGYCGVMFSSYCLLTGPWPFSNHHHKIINNFIYDVGKQWSNGAGVQMYQAGNLEIAHNEIRRSPRYAISTKGQGNVHGHTMTPEMIHTDSIHIHHNDMSHCIYNTQDVGVYEHWNPGCPITFEENLFHDIYHIADDERTGEAHGDDPTCIGRGLSQRHCIYYDAGTPFCGNYTAENCAAYNCIDLVNWYVEGFGGPFPFTRSAAKRIADSRGIDWDNIGLKSDFLWETPAMNPKEIEWPDEVVLFPEFIDEYAKKFWDGTGLQGAYFDDMNFGTEKFNQVDSLIAFNFATAVVGHDRWSARWTGSIVPLFSDEYEFNVEAAAYIKVWVNDVLVVDAWQQSGTRRVEGERVNLEANTPYDIKIEYANEDDKGALALQWWSDNTPWQIVPTSQLFPVGPNEVKAYRPAKASVKLPQASIVQNMKQLIVNIPQSSAHTVKLVTANGTVVKAIQGKGAQSYTFDKTVVASGVYFLLINSDNREITQKFMVGK